MYIRPAGTLSLRDSRNGSKFASTDVLLIKNRRSSSTRGYEHTIVRCIMKKINKKYRVIHKIIFLEGTLDEKNSSREK